MNPTALSAAAAVAAGTSLLYATQVNTAATAATALGLDSASARRAIALAEWGAIAIIGAAALGAAFAAKSVAPAIVGGAAAFALRYWYAQILNPVAA